jgi:hypothetical protein
MLGAAACGKELAMFQLFLLMLLAAPQMPGSLPDRVILRDPMQGPMPVTDKVLIPQKIPDCKTDAEIQKALAEKVNGDLQSCDPPKSAYQRR